MDILQYLKNQYDYYDKELSDPRTHNRFLIPSVVPLLGIIITYLCLVKYIIPAYMRNREPFHLKNIIFVYNLFQIITNGYIVYLTLNSGYGRRYHFLKCRDVNYSTTDPDALMAMECIYVGLFSRILEFLDTIFFALRKKNEHISFLHVFHHTTMAFNVWLAVKFTAGSSVLLIAVVNGSVHMIMYSYYLLSSLGPEWQKYLWWKKYLTIIQIIQLCCGIIGLLFALLTLEYCPELMKRKLLFWYGILYISTLLYLFHKFYKKSYNTTSEDHRGTHKTE